MLASRISDLQKNVLRIEAIQELKKIVFRNEQGVKDILISKTLFVAT